MTDIPHYDDMQVAVPDLAALQTRYTTFRTAVDEGNATRALAAWEPLRREVDTWATLTLCRFQQDTEDEDRKAARDTCNAMTADIVELEVALKRKFLDSDERDNLADTYGSYVLDRFDAAVASFDPAIAGEVTRELELASEYVSLFAAARVEFRGEKWALTKLDKFVGDDDREVREEATRAVWAWIDSERDTLDRLYGDLVQLRTEAARKLGHENYVPLGYKRMARIGYGAEDVARFRDQVRELVVPLAGEIRARQAERLGVDRVMLWDERLHTSEPDPKPAGDFDWTMDQVARVFDDTDPAIGEFFQLLRDRGLVDLEARDGKAGGGFCAFLPKFGVSFIFGNFNGSRHGVRTIVHEVGHAFQKHCCRHQPVVELMRPTMETCEIHSMSLEYLVWPALHHVFGEQTEAYRQLHLAESLVFLPYGVAVDHFQHRVYEQPDATADERAAMWQEMEARYLPHRHYGDLPGASEGRFWQRQRHIYRAPFYYIDYTLALTVALQLWVRSRTDHAGAMADYIELCKLGGSAPFAECVAAVGLRSPFEPGCLEEVVATAREHLGL